MYFFLFMSYKNFLNVLLYGLVLETLENFKNAENFCGDEKFLVIKNFFGFFIYLFIFGLS